MSAIVLNKLAAMFWAVLPLLLLLTSYYRRPCCVSATNSQNSVGETCGFASTASDSNNTCDSLMDGGEDLGVKQDLGNSSELSQEIFSALRSARSYMAEFNFSRTPRHRQLQEECKNLHDLCSLWAVTGECKTNPLYMNLTCAPLCHSCEFLLPEVRCPLDANAVDAWLPGELHRMFERITTNPDFQKFEPIVVSRPANSHFDSSALTTNKSGPWIVMFDKFMSQQEAHRVAELGMQDGLAPFPLSDDSFGFGHCHSAQCVNDPTVKALVRRVTELTNIPETNYEHLQLRQYEVNQRASSHLDYVAGSREEQQGVTILTVLFYLTDVDEGGGTNFPRLNLTVTPKQGRALIWPSVLNEDPNSVDDRTLHQGLPVAKGVKNVASIFVHQRDFKGPHAMHCVEP